MHGYIGRSLNPDADFISSDINDCDFYMITDHDALIALSGKNQHPVGSFQFNRTQTRLKRSQLNRGMINGDKQIPSPELKTSLFVPTIGEAINEQHETLPQFRSNNTQ
tara:strand:+ start:189 stop:512 length:324 start_codon:yes stop_codon:yes gene_type:complete